MHDGQSPSINGTDPLTTLRGMVEQHDAEIYGRLGEQGLREMVAEIRTTQRGHGRVLWAIMFAVGAIALRMWFSGWGGS